MVSYIGYFTVDRNVPLYSPLGSDVVPYFSICMVCEKHVGMYMLVLYLLANTISHIGIQFNKHQVIGQTLASYSIDANIPLFKPLFWHLHKY